MAERISAYNPEAGRDWRRARNYFIAGAAILLFFNPNFAVLSAVGAITSEYFSRQSKKKA